MDKRTLLAMAILFGISFWWMQQAKPPVETPVLQTKSTTHAVSNVGVRDSKKSIIKTVAAKSIGVSRDLKEEVRLSNSNVIVGNGSSIINDWILDRYTFEKPSTSGGEAVQVPVDLNRVTNLMGALRFDTSSSDLAYLKDVKGTLEKEGNEVHWLYEDQNVRIARRMVFSEQNNYVDLYLKAFFKKKDMTPKASFVVLAAKTTGDSTLDMDRLFAFYSNQEVNYHYLTDIDQLSAIKTPVKWIATSSHYFTMAVVPQGIGLPKAVIQPFTDSRSEISLVYPITKDLVSIPLRVYFGPKNTKTLSIIEPTLSEVVDFGWFTIFAKPLLHLLHYFYQYFQNYGVAIIALTFLVRLAIFPLNYKSAKSMKQMAKLNPQIQKIKERHKDDREAMNREMMMLWKTHKINPMAGCLPIVAQMPIFFALYRVLYNSVELYQEPFALWISDLSAHDPFYVLPALGTLSWWLQSKVTPTSASMDPTQQKMMQWMPVVFGVMMYSLPAGLWLYFLCSTIVGVIQQQILNKKLDALPVSPVTAGAK